MIVIKLLTIVICAVLNFIGGWKWHNARRYFMPVILGASISLVSHMWWLGLTVLPVMGILSIGYGEKSILWKYLTDAGARGMWMFLSALAIGLGCVIAGHLAWFIYVPYCILAGVLGATLRNMNEIIGDLLFGAFLASIILFVR